MLNAELVCRFIRQVLPLNAVAQLMVIVLLINGLAEGVITEFPSSVPRCKAGDAPCIQTVINNLVETGANGHPELGIQAIEPLQWKPPVITTFNGSRSSLSLKLINTDTSYAGLSHLRVVKVVGFEKNPSKSAFEIHTITPRVDVLAKYKSTAQLFGLPINGNGHSNCSLENFKASIKFYPRIETRDGQEYVHFDQIKVDFNVTRFYMQYDSQPKTRQSMILDQSLNGILNDNWHDILDDLRPSLKFNIGELIKSIAQPLFSSLPYVDFFLPDE